MARCETEESKNNPEPPDQISGGKTFIVDITIESGEKIASDGCKKKGFLKVSLWKWHSGSNQLDPIKIFTVFELLQFLLF